MVSFRFIATVKRHRDGHLLPCLRFSESRTEFVQEIGRDTCNPTSLGAVHQAKRATGSVTDRALATQHLEVIENQVRDRSQLVVGKETGLRQEQNSVTRIVILTFIYRP